MASRARVIAACAVAALALVAAGCGGSSHSGAATTTAAGAPAAGRGALAALQTCLAKHGVKTAPPAGNAQPPQAGRQPAFSAKQRKAFAACRSSLPANARGRIPGGGQPPKSGALAKYTACLRKHGVAFGQTNDQSAFKKAQTACARYAPGAAG